MKIPNRNSIVFVIVLTCAVCISALRNSQLRVIKTVNAYEGETVVLQCQSRDVSSIDHCAWTFVYNSEPDFLGKQLNMANQKDTPKPRFETSLNFKSGVCQLTISALVPSDIASYSCGIKDLNGDNLAHETYKLVLKIKDIPKDFRIEYNGQQYRKDQTLTQVPSGIRLLLKCVAGPSAHVARLGWLIDPSVGEQGGKQEEGPEGSKTMMSTIVVGLDAKRKPKLRATCVASHSGFSGGWKSISLTLVT